MSRDSTSRRRRCRPDRAQRHAELADYARVTGFYTLRSSVVDVGGEESWLELVDSLVAAKAELGEHTSVQAAIALVTALYTLHRMDAIGFRGLIGSQEAIANHTAEVLGWYRGFGVRTCRGAGRILEAADLVERWTHGRGREVELEPEAEGAKPRRCRRPVVAYTLTTVAASFWSGPRRRARRGPGVGEKPTSANGADNTTGGRRDPSAPRNAQPSISSATSAAEQLYAVSPLTGDVEHGGASSRGARASRVPHRLTPWRPGPHDPNDYGTASAAMLYDLETTLLHHRRADRPRLIGIARGELDPARRIAGIAGTGPPARGSGLPWDDWIWRWRGMPLADRRVACERAILPALAGHLRRLDLWEIAPDRGARPRVPHPREPGPRAVPERNAAPAPSVIVHGVPPGSSTPRTRAAPEPRPAWLVDLERRYGGGEDG